jgi:hypothetical protein
MSQFASQFNALLAKSTSSFRGHSACQFRLSKPCATPQRAAEPSIKAIDIVVCRTSFLGNPGNACRSWNVDDSADHCTISGPACAGLVHRKVQFRSPPQCHRSAKTVLPSLGPHRNTWKGGRAPAGSIAQEDWLRVARGRLAARHIVELMAELGDGLVDHPPGAVGRAQRAMLRKRVPWCE